MKNIVLSYISIFVLSLLLSSCETTDPKPPIPKPSGYQDDISWPPLGNEEWAISRGDAQLTGRSSVSGPTKGIVKWKIEIPKRLNDDTMLPTVISDSSVFVITYQDTGSIKSSLRSFNINTGELNWRFKLKGAENPASPIVVGNSVYAGDSLKNLYSINKETGSLNWQIQLSEYPDHITVGKDEIFYVIQQHGVLSSFNSNGDILWTTNLNTRTKSLTRIVFSPDGNTMYITANQFLAVDLQGNVIWKAFDGRDVESWGGAPIVNNDGDVFIPGGLVKISKDGINENLFDKASSEIDATIDKLGNFYTTNYSGDLESYNYKGELRWQKNINAQDWRSSLLCDVNSNIYLFTQDNSVMSVDSSGNQLWSLPLDGQQYYSPSIADGILIFGTISQEARYLYCIE